jgi:tetratricopeptide (TPR) repeat protein
MKYRPGNLFVVVISFLLLGISGSAVQAQSAMSQETLNQYLADLQRNPADNNLREKIISLTQAMTPAPAIPEEARRHFVRAVTMQREAINLNGYELAVNAYNQALLIAPWWGDAYFNLSLALESSSRYSEAVTALKFYLLTQPSSSEARAAQDKIYALEAKEEIARQQQTMEEAEKNAQEEKRLKEVDLSGTWYNDSDCWCFRFQVSGDELVVTNYCSDEHVREGIYGWATLSGRTFKGKINSATHEDGESWWGAGIFEGTVSEDNTTLKISVKSNVDANWKTTWDLYRK